MSLLLNDERLTRRAVAGDERAFAAIFDRYQEPLYRFCLSILGNPQDAQDALQNAMVKVLRALPGEEREIELKPWLYRIAHNEAIELVRRRRPTTELDPELPGAGAGLAEEAEQRQRLARLISDLGQLPDRQRGALVMRELGDLDFEEIAAALGTSAATARQTVYEARLGLREMEAGREMSCLAVTKAISDGDGRVLRRRDIRSHLRGCEECQLFREEISGRERDLAALAPLPAIAAAAMFKSLVGGGGAGGAAAGGGGAGAGGIGAGLGGSAAAKSIAASSLLKGIATVAVVAAVGVTAADRGGVINLDPGGSSGAGAGAAAGASAAGSAGAGGDAATSRSAASAAPAAAAGRVGNGAQPGSGAGGGEGAADSAPTVPTSAATPTTAATTPDSAAHPGASPTLPSAASHGQETAAAHGQKPSTSHGEETSASHKSEGGEVSEGAKQGEPPAAAQPPIPAHPTPPPEPSSGAGKPETPAAETPPAAEKGQEKAAEAKESHGMP